MKFSSFKERNEIIENGINVIKRLHKSKGSFLGLVTFAILDKGEIFSLFESIGRHITSTFIRLIVCLHQCQLSMLYFKFTSKQL